MSLPSVEQALAELDDCWTADRCAGIVLFDASGREVHRCRLSDQIASLSLHYLEPEPQVLGLPETMHARARALQAYGRVIGGVAWLGEDPERLAQATSNAERLCSHAARLATLDFEIDNLARELAETYESIHLLCDVTRSSSLARNLDELCDELLLPVVRQIRCRAGFVLQVEPGEETLVRVVSATGELLGLTKGSTLPVSGLLARVRDRPCLEMLDIDEQLPVVARSDRLMSLAARSCLVAPMVVHDRFVGAFVLIDRCSADGEVTTFDSRDGKLVDAVATQAAAMIQGVQTVALSKEMEIARRIQQQLLPTTLPRIAGVELAASCAMANVIGGDLYQVLELKSGEIALLVADVSGHDLGAALLMATARAQLRFELQSASGPAQALTRLNRDLYDDLAASGLFLTVFVAFFDPRTGVLRYAGGGHNPALLLKSSSEKTEFLQSSGLPAGLVRDVEHSECQEELVPGDLLLLYTDGFTEAMNFSGEMFGEERLGGTLEKVRFLPALRILESLLREVQDHRGGRPLQDDGTLLLMHVTSRTEESRSGTELRA